MNTRKNSNDRLGAVLDHVQVMAADRAEERDARRKSKTITINFSEAELAELRAKAEAAAMKLQDYIRMILKTYTQ